MAFEINEIGISMRVAGGKPMPQQQQQPGSAPSCGDSSKGGADDAVVRECVKRVLQALREMKER
jgi:hypothetical protein